MIRSILLIDPLTLIGRELLGCLVDEGYHAADLAFRHTAEDDEHQLANVGGQSALVPPLEEAGEMPISDVVILASDADSPRLRQLVDHLETLPGQRLIDLSGLAGTRRLGIPTTWSAAGGDGRLRPAHPAVVAAAAVIEALAELEPIGGALAIVDPVSGGGRAAVELLAAQAVSRLQGGTPEDLFDGHVLAFNAVADDPTRLAEEAAAAIPDLPLAVTWTRTGCFHGHLAHFVLELGAPRDDDSTARRLLEADERLAIAEEPLGLGQVVESDRVHVSLPVFARDRRRLAMTLMVDGLRIGGARTAVALLRQL